MTTGAGVRVRPGRPWRHGRHGERGSGTVLVAGTIVVLMVASAAVLVIGAYLVAADHARGAADLVAISAAAKVAQRSNGCAAATEVANSNGVSLVRCAVRGDSLDFVVSVTVRQSIGVGLPLLPEGVSVTAHAGRLGVINHG